MALKYFEMGRIDSTYQILIPCLMDSRELKSVSRKERGDIYKLAADAAYYLGLFDEAERYSREFRTIQPAYKPSEEDLMEFQEHIQSTRLYPKTYVGLKIAYSMTGPEVINRLTPYVYEGDEFYLQEGVYSYDLSLMIGLQIKRYIHPRVAIGTELIYGDLTSFSAPDSYNPIKGSSSFMSLDINAIEWPVFLSFNLINSKVILAYAELGFSLTVPVNPWFPDRTDYEKRESESFGKYYYLHDYDDAFSHAYFFESPLEYNLVTGFGMAVNMGVLNFGLSFRYFPKIFRSNPFEDISSFEDIPANDDLYYCDDIFLIRLNGHFQISLVLGLNLNYRAY